MSIDHDAGQAIADSIIDALESSTLGLANAIRAVREDQAEARETLRVLLNRVEVLERIVFARVDHLA